MGQASSMRHADSSPENPHRLEPHCAIWSPCLISDQLQGSGEALKTCPAGPFSGYKRKKKGRKKEERRGDGKTTESKKSQAK